MVFARFKEYSVYDILTQVITVPYNPILKDHMGYMQRLFNTM